VVLAILQRLYLSHDGTHVPIKIYPSKQIPYIGRKWTPTRNVMAVCDFHIHFIFVWARWEGITHDTRIFLETIRKEELRFSHSPRGLYLIKITIMNYTLKNIYFNIFYERHLHIYYRKILLDRRRISSHEGIHGAIQM
jgi:hypothetical protein